MCLGADLSSSFERDLGELTFAHRASASPPLKQGEQTPQSHGGLAGILSTGFGMRVVPSASLSGEHTPFLLICIVPWDFRVPRILSTLKCCQSFRLSRLDVRSAQDLPMGKSSFCCLLRLSLFPSCLFAKLKAAWAIARKTSGDMCARVFESRLPLCDFFFFFHKAALSTLFLRTGRSHTGRLELACLGFLPVSSTLMLVLRSS